MPRPTILTRKLGFEASGKKILSGVSLAFAPGRITAVIGPSGSGKSTLLKCLATAYRPTEGSILFNDRELSEQVEPFRQNLGYVPQDDIIHSELRVTQAFYYAAKLRQLNESPEKDIWRRIDETTRQLGLYERRRYRIRNLSGGQRKRVNIGVELLGDPGVLILDEPASGLDPATEEDLLKVLRSLAAQKRTVVLTTHSMEYLSLVDQIVVLLEGAVIFSGSLRNLLAFFRIGHVADVFKTIRANNRIYWQNRFRLSPLATATSSSMK